MQTASSLVRSISVSIAACLLLTACASRWPVDYPRSTSHAIQEYQATAAGRVFEEASARHPGESGFGLVSLGRNAFTARIAMIDLAERSLDLQYYIWDADITGRILAERLVRAADRDVRIRLLVDDNGIGGTDADLASLNAHPNIEFRIFNPFASRNVQFWDFIVDFSRVNHRMHNKSMVMDNAIAIVGGRNIGDHYFGVNTDANYRDLDIFAAGPIVRDVSTVFDRFWNGDWAVPIDALVDRPYDEGDLAESVRRMRDNIADSEYPYPLDQDLNELNAQLVDLRNGLIWANSGIVYDDPESVKEGVMNEALFRKFDTLQRELLIESAYFVPGERGVDAARALNERGVRVRILTNSLASNDVLAAHSGYAKYREDLIEVGVEMHELRPDIRKEQRASVISGIDGSKAALHTKALVFDRESVFIGSFNLDPRSANINTEVGIYVESEELASQLVDYMDEGAAPQSSYRVLLGDDGDLYWIAEDDGQEMRYERDPESTFWQRFMSGFIGILPVESQL